MLTVDQDKVADGLVAIADALHRLGTADAATPMGAIEFLAFEIKEGTERIANSLDRIAEALETAADPRNEP